MSKNLLVLKKPLLKRRKFLSGAAAAGTLATIDSVAGPVRAMAIDLSPAQTAEASVATAQRGRAGANLGNVCVEDFTDLVGQTFRLRQQGGSVTRTRLIEATASAHPGAPRGRAQQFSLVFDVPAGLERVQGDYRINHPRVGNLDVFMVPVDLPSKHNRLQALFA